MFFFGLCRCVSLIAPFCITIRTISQVVCLQRADCRLIPFVPLTVSRCWWSEMWSDSQRNKQSLFRHVQTHTTTYLRTGLYTKAKHSDKSWEDLGQSAQTKKIHCTCLTNFSKYHPHDQCGFVQSISKYVTYSMSIIMTKKLTLFQCNGWSDQDYIINCTIK